MAERSYFRDDVLEGRVALITGGGSGIGFEVARQFGLHGCKGVVLMGRRKQFLDKAVELLKKDNIQAVCFAGDVRNSENCSAAVALAVETYGGLDVLVNAAAGNFLAAAEEISGNGFKAVMDIDAVGTFNVTRAAFEALRQSPYGGVVTSITATLHYTATWYQTAPVAAKAAIDAMTRNLALEWGEFGLRCNAVAPGPIAETPGLEKLSGGKEISWDWIPARRAGTKGEIASACIYLCLNRYITGQTLPVDGGEWFGKKPMMPREVVSQISRGVEKQSRSMGPGAKSKL
ncbi:4-dienoyl-CoA reductase [(3E)-enoyl-CoA-producing] [Durusdinium trenchii]|uniref:2,4-dienoyl-CoA reductase [(3E)-enoyl-CoA-producing] n=1 Tax=Durusdinium trenchii TaxID=1381693 RepID=A0ABP0JGU1_9DINO